MKAPEEFTTIDFETANADMASICQIFDAINVSIHCIDGGR